MTYVDKDLSLASFLVGNFVESLVDNVFRDKVSSPAVGSMVYCDLLLAEHSGIYIGDGKIVQLDGGGLIEVVNHEVFMDRLDGLNTAISIYVSCHGTTPVGNPQAAELARAMIGEQRDYNILIDNCHQFTAGCLIGDFNNSFNFFPALKQLAEESLCADNWRVWDR